MRIPVKSERRAPLLLVAKCGKQLLYNAQTNELCCAQLRFAFASSHTLLRFHGVTRDINVLYVLCVRREKVRFRIPVAKERIHSNRGH